MNNNWWRNPDQLDKFQRAFIALPKAGKYSLEGPPGSGKTNLLLLRAQYIAGGGEKNVLIITFTNTLRNFIRSGIGGKGLIASNQIQTFHSWAAKHVMEHLGFEKNIKGIAFNDEARIDLLSRVKEANKKLPSHKIYDAIFVDEVQDLTVAELESLLCLSDKICICGDARQGIYKKDGFEVSEHLGLAKHRLENHFRIGHRIAQVADKLIPVPLGAVSLEGSSAYNIDEMGEATARLHSCDGRNSQFAQMLELIRVQLDAFNEDTIGILCGKKESVAELKERFEGTDLADEVVYHGLEAGANFTSGKRIHILTMHGSKGTEFRSVHMYGVEELADFPLNQTKLAYTAVTRAKTSLNAYSTGSTSPKLESAFSEPTVVMLEDLF
jgi:superfamily I DNA/RNA helicase